MKSFFFTSFFVLLISFSSQSKDIWILDKDLSIINFELPVLLANNIKGTFKEIEGLVEIDLEEKKNSTAFFSIEINSIEMNYKKYQKLLLSNIFFDTHQFPKALINNKEIFYDDQSKIKLNIELTIKGITNVIPLSLEVIKLAEDLVQIKGNIKFSRTSFQIGIKEWNNTSILRDKVTINVNLFFFKK